MSLSVDLRSVSAKTPVRMERNDGREESGEESSSDLTDFRFESKYAKMLFADDTHQDRRRPLEDKTAKSNLIVHTNGNGSIDNSAYMTPAPTNRLYDGQENIIPEILSIKQKSNLSQTSFITPRNHTPSMHTSTYSGPKTQVSVNGQTAIQPERSSSRWRRLARTGLGPPKRANRPSDGDVNAEDEIAVGDIAPKDSSKEKHVSFNDESHKNINSSSHSNGNSSYDAESCNATPRFSVSLDSVSNTCDDARSENEVNKIDPCTSTITPASIKYPEMSTSIKTPARQLFVNHPEPVVQVKNKNHIVVSKTFIMKFQTNIVVQWTFIYTIRSYWTRRK